MFIPKHDKVKKLLFLQLNAQVPEEEDQKSLYAASEVSPNANHQDKHLLCSPLTTLPNHYLMLHRYWRIHILRNQRANNHFLIVLHRFGTNIYVFMLGNWKGIVMKLIILLLWQQFNILRKKHKTDELSPDFEGADDDSFSLQQNPTKTPIILKKNLRVLPHCPIIHWASQMCDDPRL